MAFACALWADIKASTPAGQQESVLKGEKTVLSTEKSMHVNIWADIKASTPAGQQESVLKGLKPVLSTGKSMHVNIWADIKASTPAGQQESVLKGLKTMLSTEKSTNVNMWADIKASTPAGQREHTSERDLASRRLIARTGLYQCTPRKGSKITTHTSRSPSAKSKDCSLGPKNLDLLNELGLSRNNKD